MMNKNVIVFAKSLELYQVYMRDEHGIYQHSRIYNHSNFVVINGQTYHYCHSRRIAESTLQPADILLLYGWDNKKWNVEIFVRRALIHFGSSLVGSAYEMQIEKWNEFKNLEKIYQDNKEIKRVRFDNIINRFKLMEL